MPRSAFAAAVIAAFAPMPACAQDETAARLTPEEMIAAAREAYRPPGLGRSCAPGAPGEIVVCAPEQRDIRVESPTAEAIRKGQPVHDIPRAPEMAPPPCDPRSPGCFKFGAPPPMPPLIDLEALPHPLPPEEAARVFRAEDRPTPAAASPAAAP